MKNKNFVDSVGHENIDDKKIGSGKFTDYWLKEDCSIHDLVEWINENSDGKLLFEKKNHLWILTKGYKSNANQLNFGGFVKALIQLKYLKSSIIGTKEDCMSLSDVFYFESQSEDKQFQRLYGQLYKEIPSMYVTHCEQILINSKQ
ncbi:hypothetical protein ACFRAE_10345 [Sphingobacterium sp. HJSM2_6]|uniref:hypothetical protein n=1 Tax=Sphingobacterium sp. HJSM2_6 TaxID=3366264 RepID=UPI003BCDD3B8